MSTVSFFGLFQSRATPQHLAHGVVMSVAEKWSPLLQSSALFGVGRSATALFEQPRQSHVVEGLFDGFTAHDCGSLAQSLGARHVSLQLEECVGRSEGMDPPQ